MVISSNALFHFMRKFETLKETLQDLSFETNYCLEYDKGMIEEDRFYAIPMVCFCDIPLSLIGEHIKDYGHYALGMNKKWAGKKVSPILYYKDKKSLSKTIYDQMANRSNNKIDDKQCFLYFSLLKRYYGKTWSASMNKGQGDYRNKVLYNEREWRFVPRKLKADDLVLKVKDYDDLVKQPKNSAVKNAKLNFTINDINFIIVDTDDDRLPLIKHINDKFGNTDETKILCSKILTIKQIKENF